MDLSDEEVERRAAADRRVVDPRVQVEMATWSPGGQLDWWVKEHRPRVEWWGEYAVLTVGNGGSKLLIFVPQAAHSHELLRYSGSPPDSLTARRLESKSRERAHCGLEIDMERIRRHTDKPIRDDWKDVVEEILTQEVPKRAQAIADKEPGTEPIVVRVPVTFFVRFGRQADNVVAANGDTDCACFADAEVCVCYGPCDPDICDDIPPITKG